MNAQRILAMVGRTAAVIAWAAAAHAADAPIVVDDFESVSAWSPFPSEGVTMKLSSGDGEHGKALRMDVKFTRGTGYAVARRAVSLDLPADYVFRMRMKADIPTNHLEFKLVDSTGNNVWWYVRRDFEYPREWTTISTRKRQIRFAWGPLGGGPLKHVAFIEIAVTAGEGGAGSVWLDDFTLEPLPAESTLPRIVAKASSGVAAGAADGSMKTAWRSAPRDSLPWLELDLGRAREFGGLDLSWGAQAMSDYVVDLSLDRTTWAAGDTVRNGDGGRDPLYLPESEARYLRVRALQPVTASVELREATIKPLEWSATPAAYFTNLAKVAPRGTYPRPYVGEQCAWTVVGPDAGREEALLSEDGMVETGKGRYSIEPFLWLDGKLITWADVTARQSLAPGEPPVPTVGWSRPDVGLTVTAIAGRDTALPMVRVQYRVSNPRARALPVRLFLVSRPFQVNPPWQNIGFAGGPAKILAIEQSPSWCWVNGHITMRAWPAATEAGTQTLDQGEITERLRRGQVPASRSVADRHGFASGVMAWDLEIPPGGEKSIDIDVLIRPPRYLSPQDLAGGNGAAPPIAPPGVSPGPWFLLPGGPDVAETMLAQVGYILVNRDGAAIQPGSRNYDRSWIRDGSLTSSALLRMGRTTVVRDFIQWFAPFQYPNGKIPCCASEKGPDPVTENDSHGEFIWLVAEYYRYTGDRATVERMWPHVAAAVEHMDSLRAQRLTPEWQGADKRKFYGLLTPSISHEGYPNPVHSYWDDFFAYRGYVDAAYLADVLGRIPDRERISASRDAFAYDLTASIAAAMKEAKIDYVPGCAELGDFDATSTTVALTPTGAADLLPPAAVRATFERYWKFFTDRRDGKIRWDGFTPYEVRTIGSFVRLGWRDRANAALDWFMQYRTPPGWRQWAEVAYRQPRTPKYVGDMPHTWVGSDFVRSVLDMLAYERGRDSSLVVGAGVPWKWLGAGSPVEVRSVQTIYGPMRFAMQARGDTVETSIDAGLRIPDGGIVVIPPALRPFRHASVNGVDAPITAEGGVVVRAVPAKVVLRP
jgi:hypothetical protein